MKIKDLIKKLQELDGNKEIFYATFDMCDDIVVKEIGLEEIKCGLYKHLTTENIGDYCIQESEVWLKNNS